jgi:hypothetical protein
MEVIREQAIIDQQAADHFPRLNHQALEEAAQQMAAFNRAQQMIFQVNPAAAGDLVRVIHDWAQVIEEAEGPLGSKGKRKEELFQLILSGIREIYEVDAVIAGGAVRDMVAGFDKHKDVDVFIPLEWADFEKNMAELGWQGRPALQKKVPYKGIKTEDVASTARASAVVQGCPIDLVFVKKPLEPKGVEQFPIYAQRCVWTLGSGVAVSPEAKKDIDNKTFTIDPTITDKDRIKGLEAKCKEWLKRGHYKDWKIVLPEIKEWWEENAKKPE